MLEKCLNAVGLVMFLLVDAILLLFVVWMIAEMRDTWDDILTGICQKIKEIKNK